METNLKPFTMEWTINKTVERLLKSIDFSLNKVIARIPEFEGNSEKSTEILKTIIHLTNLKAGIESSCKKLNENLSNGE